MMVSMASLPAAEKLFCPHCNTYVPKSTWYRHYSQYYNLPNNTWRSENAHLEADLDFGTDSDSEEIDRAVAYVPDVDLSFSYEEAMETVCV